MSSNSAFTCCEEQVPKPVPLQWALGVCEEFVYMPRKQSHVMEILKKALLNFTFLFSSLVERKHSFSEPESSSTGRLFIKQQW